MFTFKNLPALLILSTFESFLGVVASSAKPSALRTGERARMRAELDAGALKMSLLGADIAKDDSRVVVDVARAMEAARNEIEREGPLSVAERATRDCTAIVNAALAANQ